MDVSPPPSPPPHPPIDKNLNLANMCSRRFISNHQICLVLISFMGGKPLINGNPKFVWIKTNSFISFIKKENPYKTGTPNLSGLKRTFQVENDNTVVKRSIVHIVKRRFSFHSYNGNPCKTGTLNLSGLKRTFQVVNENTKVNSLR